MSVGCRRPVLGKAGGWLSAALCAFVLAACDGGGDTPTAPPAPPSPPPGGDSSLTLDLSADLEARSNPVLIGRAELRYDGSTVTTRFRCLETVVVYCRRARLTASSTTTRGAHTVALKLLFHTFDLLQSDGKASYDSGGTVTVRDASGVLQEIALPKRTVSLGPGESVEYAIVVLP